MGEDTKRESEEYGKEVRGEEKWCEMTDVAGERKMLG